MQTTLFPILFILAGMAVITFNRRIAANSLRTYKMMRVRLLIPEEDLPYAWIAIGALMIVVGTMVLFETIDRF